MLRAEEGLRLLMGGQSSIYLSVVNSVRVTVLFLILPTVISFIRRGVTTDRMRVGSDMLDIKYVSRLNAAQVADNL